MNLAGWKFSLSLPLSSISTHGLFFPFPIIQLGACSQTKLAEILYTN